MNNEQQYLEYQIQYHAIYFLKKHLDQNYNPSLPGVNLDFFVDLQEQEIIKINQEMSDHESNNLSGNEENIRNAYINLSEEITIISNSKKLANLMAEKTGNIIYNSENETIYIPDIDLRNKFLEYVNTTVGGTIYAGGEWIKERIINRRTAETVVEVYNKQNEHIETITFPNNQMAEEYLADKQSRLKQINAKCRWWDKNGEDILLETEEYLNQKFLNEKNEVCIKNCFKAEHIGSYYKNVFINSLSMNWENAITITKKEFLDEIKKIEDNINKFWHEQGVKAKTKLIDKNKNFVAKFFITIQPLEVNYSKEIARYRVSAKFQNWILWSSLSIKLKKQILSLLYQEIDYKRTNITHYFTDENYANLGFARREIAIINFIMIKKNNGANYITIDEIIMSTGARVKKAAVKKLTEDEKIFLLEKNAKNLICALKKKINNTPSLNITIGNFNKDLPDGSFGYPIL